MPRWNDGTAGHMERYAGCWTKSGMIGLPSQTMVKGVGRHNNNQFALPALGHRDLPHIVIGDLIATVPHVVMTQQVTMEKRWNSGQIHATSYSSMLLNCRHPSTVQDGRNATTQISSLHLEASQTCVRSQSWPLSRTPNTAGYVLAPNQSWYHKLYFSGDVLTL